MSNYDLESELSSLESEISAVEAENRRMEGELNALYSAASSSNVALVGAAAYARNTLEESKNIMNYSNEQIKKTYGIQLQIKELYYIFKDVETANKRIRLLNNKLYYEFKNHSKVRKILRGFMDNLDLDMVKDEVIFKSVERSFLENPNYSLAYVLLAIMHWKNSEEQKANEALEHALDLDTKNTAIFFMLFYLKIRRYEAALEWFNLYDSLEKTGSDNLTFLMLFSSIKSKINEYQQEDDITNAIKKYIDKEILEDTPNVDVDKTKNIILQYFINTSTRSSINYPTINKYLQEAGILQKCYDLALNNQNILDFIESFAKVKYSEKNMFIERYIDKLIAIPSEDEKVIIDEIEKNDLLIKSLESIKHQEDDILIKKEDFKRIVEEKYQAKIKHETSNLNVINEIVDWVYVHKRSDINSLTKYNLFALIKNYTKDAYEMYKTNYQSQKPKVFTLIYKDLSFKTSFNSLQEDIDRKNQFIDEVIEERIAQVSDKKCKKQITIWSVCSILSLILGALSFVLSLPSIGVLQKQYMWLLLIIFVALILVGTIQIIKNIIKIKVKNPKAREKIKEELEQERVVLDKIINDLYTEYEQYTLAYDEADKVSNYVGERLSEV